VTEDYYIIQVPQTCGLTERLTWGDRMNSAFWWVQMAFWLTGKDLVWCKNWNILWFFQWDPTANTRSTNRSWQVFCTYQVIRSILDVLDKAPYISFLQTAFTCLQSMQKRNTEHSQLEADGLITQVFNMSFKSLSSGPLAVKMTFSGCLSNGSGISGIVLQDGTEF